LPTQDVLDRDEDETARIFAAIVERLQRGDSPEEIFADLKSDLPTSEIQAALKLAQDVAVPLVRRVPEVPGYRLLRPLGQGSSGVVWLASQVSLGREVALKVIEADAMRAPSLRERCLREARTLACIRDPRVVAVHDVVEHSDRIAIAMDLVQGPNLRTLLRAVRARPQEAPPVAAAHFTGIARSCFGPSWPIWVVRQGIRVARALGCLHSQGLVHRDVKPENLLLQSDGDLVLADLGLARSESSGGFSGTLLYASPEQAANAETVDGRADVYSLALVLYELLARSLPLADRLQRDGAGPRLQLPLPPLKQRARDVSLDLAVVLHHALETDPDRRYPTADAFAEDLERVSHLMPILAVPPGPLGRAARFLQRHRRSALAVGLAIALTCAGFVPVLRGLQEQFDAPRAAAAHVQMARSSLLAAFDGNREESLRQAVAYYDQALLRVPDPAVKRERDVSELAAELLEAQRGEFSRLLAAELADPTAAMGASLGPEVRAAALQWLRSQTMVRPAVTAPQINASPSDERSIGLLACLLGDLRSCEAAWSRLDPDAADLPLVDAGLGLLFEADGRPELALPCLLRASSGFPTAGRVAVALADTALRLGDQGLARRSLDRARRCKGAPEGMMQRIEADLAAASGDVSTARAVYEQLIAIGTGNAEVLHRLASLDARSLRHRECVDKMRQVVQAAPDRADYRLALARAALAAGDFACYVQEAREAVRRLRATPEPTRGAARSWLEILQAGGCARLSREIASRLGLFDVLSVPTESVSASIASHGASGLLERIVERLCIADAHSWTIPESQDRQLVQLLSGLTRSAIAAPDVVIALHPLLGRVLVAAAVVADRNRSYLVQEAIPRAWLAAEAAILQAKERSAVTIAASGAAVCSSPVRWFDGPSDCLAIAACVAESSRPKMLSAVTRLGNSVAGNVRVFAWNDLETPLALHATEPSAVLGCRLCVLDDSGADPAIALAVGAVGRGQGGVRVVSTKTGNVRWQLAQATGERSMSWSMDVVGDVDGDGLQDLAVGCPSPEHPLQPIDTVRVLSGRDGHPLAAFGGPANRFCGIAVAAVGDLDGDGLADLAVGCPHRQGGPGLVVVMSPRTGAVLRELPAPGGEPGFGRILVSLPDVDGDGRFDLAISDAAVSNSRTRYQPQVWVIGSKTGTAVWRRAAIDSDPSFGSALAAVADLDGDACADVLIGAPNSGVGQCGLVLACSGRDGHVLRTVTGRSLRESLGVRLLGNATNQGQPPLAVACSASGMLRAVSLDLAPSPNVKPR
jgi:tRNA A-37 threonylcarbamoyl transferase component Bud32